nr:hypothetical protein GCM10025732_35000 [Glycomyces mayteni]
MGEWNAPVSRRRALGIGAGIGAVAAGGLALSAAWARRPAATGDLLRSAVPLPEPFTAPLPVPPVLAPVESTADGDRYELVQQEAEAEIIPGFATRLWTYGGVFPGPTIEARRGRHTTVLHRNELPVPTVLHLHGGRTPAASDGYPTDLVLPDGWTGHAGHSMADDRAAVANLQREYGFPLDQRAAMLWYHDHRMDFTAPAIWRGLAGLHLVRDDVEDALDLPRGDRELPLMIADRAFDEDGQLAYPAVDPSLTGEHGVTEPYLAGVLGDVVLVNGAPWPEHEVDTGLYRLRVLNASNARHYELEAVADDGRTVPLVQIGADQGLLAAPVPHDRLPIAPAERYDLLVDFGACPSAPPCACATGSGPAPPPTSCGSASPATALRRRSPRPSPTTSPSGTARMRPSSATSPSARAAWTTGGTAGSSTASRSTRPAPTSPPASATSRCGGSSPTSTTPSTCTSWASGCSRAAAARPCRTTPGSRTRSRCAPASRPRSSPASTATGAATSSTATTPSTRTWG